MRRAIRGLAGAVAAACLAGTLTATALGATQKSGAWSFPSEPSIAAPGVHVVAGKPGPAAGSSATQASGYLFLAPIKNFAYRASFAGKPGPEIMEPDGNLVWQHPLGNYIKAEGHGREVVAMDFHAETYEGQPVLVWWQGYITPEGYGNGTWEVVNDHYQPVAHISAPRGYALDFHEIQMTSDGDAYILGWHIVPLDLHCCGGPANGSIYDQVVFEVNIHTGRVLWRWDPLQHIPLRSSYTVPSGSSTWDPYHLNSISFGPSGAPIISARNTWAAYWVNRANGAVFATLGGKHSSFKLGGDVPFAWQHDVNQIGGGRRISLFDDEAAPVEGKQSRGLLILLDWTHHTAELERQLLLPHPALAGSQGNVQLLPDGNLFVGWGQLPYFSEYTVTGQLLYLGQLPGADESYRTFRAPWVGEPASSPSIATSTSHGSTDVYASWNGSTQVSSWQLEAGPRSGALAPVGAPVARQGFETQIVTSAAGPYFAVKALGPSGVALATSATVK